MKWFATMLFVLMITASTSQGKERTEYIGEISHSQCAMNVHSLSRSHAEMIKKKTLGSDPASCARACVRRGGEWVLEEVAGVRFEPLPSWPRHITTLATRC